MRCQTRLVLGALMLCCVLGMNVANAETTVSEKAQRFFNRGSVAIEAARGRVVISKTKLESLSCLRLFKDRLSFIQGFPRAYSGLCMVFGLEGIGEVFSA